MFVKELKKSNFDFEKLPNDLRDTAKKLLEVPETKEDSQKVQLLDYTVIKAIASIFPKDEAVVNIYNSMLKMEQNINNDGFNTDFHNENNELQIGDKIRNAVGILLRVTDKNDSEYFLTSSNTIGAGLPWGKEKVHKYLSEGLWKKTHTTEKMAIGGKVTKYQDLSQLNPSVINDKNANKTGISKINEVDLIKINDFYFTGSEHIRSSVDSSKMFLEFWNENKINIQEEFSVLFLNRQNKAIGIYNVSKGGIAGTVVDVELISATAIKTLAQGVIMAHNHPSGNLKPSQADIDITKKLKNALALFDIRLLDSLIITPKGEYYSLADNNMFEDGGEIKTNIQKEVLSALAKPGEIKGVTVIEVSEDGKEVKYGTKNNKTRLSVENLSKEEIKNELKFEQSILNRSIKEAQDFSEDAIWEMKGLTREEKLFAIKIHNSSLKVNEQTSKIVIPFYQKHLNLLGEEYAYGGVVHKESPGMDKNTGNRPSPTAHASHLGVGVKAIGNDGGLWEVRADRNNIHSWKNIEGNAQEQKEIKSLHDLHPLDMWVQYPDGRWYRKFLFGTDAKSDNIRELLDQGIKESMTYLEKGKLEAVISVMDGSEAERVSNLYMKLFPVEGMILNNDIDLQDIEDRENEEFFRTKMQEVITKKVKDLEQSEFNSINLNDILEIKTTGLKRRNKKVLSIIEKTAVRDFWLSGEGDKNIMVSLFPKNDKNASPYIADYFEIYDTNENAEIRQDALNNALCTDYQKEIIEQYRLMFLKLFGYYQSYKKENPRTLIGEGYEYALDKIKDNYEFTPNQADWIANNVDYQAVGILEYKLEFLNRQVRNRFTLEKLGPLKMTSQEYTTQIVGYTSAPESYDLTGTKTIELTEYFDDRNRQVRKVGIKEAGYKPQIDRFASGNFGFFDEADFQKLVSYGENGVYSKKKENKIDITAYKNPYELNRGIEKFLDENWDKEEYTSNEIDFISYYSGYGGLHKLGKFSPEEFKTILYEFYTPDEIVKKMWALAYKYGYGSFGDGSVFEPSVGIGAFLKYAPKEVKVVANEINKYSAKICSILYPHADVQLMSFEKNFIKNNLTIKSNIDNLDKYNLVIGNPPYGPAQSKYMKFGEDKYIKAGNFTEYFISRGLDLLYKDGLLVYIVGAEQHSGGTLFLDSATSKVKEGIFQKGELLDAYRLPINVFERTGVSSEILIFKRK